jgi:hypothetical protein
MKRNIIQMVVTFHGGMVAIGYEWGSLNHPSPKDNSPDHNAYVSIGNVLKQYGGKFLGEKEYTGRFRPLFASLSLLLSLSLSFFFFFFFFFFLLVVFKIYLFFFTVFVCFGRLVICGRMGS